MLLKKSLQSNLKFISSINTFNSFHLNLTFAISYLKISSSIFSFLIFSLTFLTSTRKHSSSAYFKSKACNLVIWSISNLYSIFLCYKVRPSVYEHSYCSVSKRQYTIIVINFYVRVNVLCLIILPVVLHTLMKMPKDVFYSVLIFLNICVGLLKGKHAYFLWDGLTAKR